MWWITLSAAATLYVGPNEDFTRIQDAVRASGYHDTIVLRSGTWDEAVTARDRWLTFEADGPVTWRASGAHVLTVERGSITLRGLTLDAGRAGGVTILDGALIIEQSVVGGYDGNEHGALTAERSTLWLVDSWLQDNAYRARNDTLWGAGISSEESAVLLLRTTVRRNVGHIGAAIYSTLDDIQIIDCTFEGNEAHLEGGGFASGGYGAGGYYDRSSSFVVRGSTFRDNYAELGGAGLRPWDFRGDGQVIIEGCTFLHNEAADGGAAIAINQGVDAVVRDSYFEDNVGGDRGGDLQVWSTSHLAVTRNVSCRSSAPLGDGGFAWVSGSGEAVWSNNLIARPLAASVGGAWYLSRTGTQRFHHNTIIAAGAPRAAILYADGGTIDLTSSLLLDARLGAAVDLDPRVSSASLAWSAWFGNGGGDVVGPWSPTSGVFTDPSLHAYDPLDPCAVQDQPRVGSPLIDAGDPAVIDLDGTRADIGRWGGPLALRPDADGDGAPESYDCDDNNPIAHPGAPERCDGVDEDCDGRIDLPAPVDAPTWYGDDDGDDVGRTDTPVVACARPPHTAPVGGDCDDHDPATLGPGPEICNGVDDDCDGVVDGSVTGELSAWAPDGDGDGHGDAATPSLSACQPPDLLPATDCDDADPTRHPGAIELCDGEDQDCDNLVDGPDVPGATPRYIDGDGDGYGVGVPVWVCGELPGRSGEDGDCDDSSGDISPAASERCDGVDEDCDGEVDLPVPPDAPLQHLDVDTDGFGDATDLGVASCAPVPGRVPDARDCDDLDATRRPGAPERCDDIDQDCDGDPALPVPQDAPLWTVDADADGFGALLGAPVLACEAPPGHAVPSDCDDADSALRPGATELCNQLDDDCDGVADEDPPQAPVWFIDADEDGFGGELTVQACSPVGAVAISGDCDDARGDVWPGADERCDDADQDCDGAIDEDAVDAPPWFPDGDGDGFGTSPGTSACAAPDGAVGVSGDCDDARGDVWPGADERCDDADQDCDGAIDEDAVDARAGWEDQDGDAWGSEPVFTCAPEAAQGGDCDDEDPTRNPDATDPPRDGVDQDCDGRDGGGGGGGGCATSSGQPLSWVWILTAATTSRARRRALSAA